MAEGRRRPLRHRLTFRFGVGLCLGSAVILAVVATWNLALQREHMTKFVEHTAERAVETIQRSARDAMLRNSPGEVHRILASIGQQAEIERIRIFDREGRISVSTHPDELDTVVDRTADQCIQCHHVEPPRVDADRRFRARSFTDGAGRRILGMTSPILNEPACSASCHAHTPDQKVLGVLDVQLSLDEVDGYLAASERQMGAGLTVTVLAVLLFAGFLVWLLVVRPVRYLTRATVRLGRGEAAHVPATTADEMGTLARSWNQMVEELTRARSALEEWGRTLEHRVEEKTHALQEAHRRVLLVEKMASLGKLSAVVAHEINNPLAGIATYARLLRKRHADDGETSRVLTLLEEEAIRCGAIVKNLLLFSRGTGARFAENDLVALVERTVLLVRHQAELQDVTIRTEFAPQPLPVRCDAGQIQQVLVALAMNGIEAMPGGGVLALRARREAEETVLEVADTGCGIAPEHRERIFEPFFTTKEEGKGVGLGLAVAYGIVTRHGGRIDCDSRRAEGTTFTVHLPLHRATPTEQVMP